MIPSENRFPPRIKCGTSCFEDQARSLHRSIAGLHGAHAVLPVAWRA